MTGKGYALDSDLSAVDSRLSAAETDVDTILSDYVVRADLSDYTTTAELGDVVELASYLSVDTTTDEISLSGVDVFDINGLLTIDETNEEAIFTGLNVYVQSGSGSTNDNINDDLGGTATGSILGLGNLIIGYDEGTGTKSGSHNLVMGHDNIYTSYGSIVTGNANRVQAEHTAVIGGLDNIIDAGGNYSVIISGQDNDILSTATKSAIVGGYRMEASGDLCVGVGGDRASVSGNFATLLGGYQHTCTVDYDVCAD